MKYPVRVLISPILKSIAKPMAHGLWSKKPSKASHTFRDSWGICNSGAQYDAVYTWAIEAQADEKLRKPWKFNWWSIS